MKNQREPVLAKINSAIRTAGVAVFATALCILTACSNLDKPKTEPFFAQTAPPPKQEFRWSNGKLPKSLDPAKAAAPPETDVVRAVYEGLTETDARTLDAVPGVAEKWSASDDFKTWTFTLRADAKWSNGKAVTAYDFVRSWQRLARMGNDAANSHLLRNIVGASPSGKEPDGEVTDFILQSTETPDPTMPTNRSANSNRQPDQLGISNSNANAASSPNPLESKFGFVAEDTRTFKVTLISPDKDFPKLAANPIFRPVYGDDGGTEFETENIVTNGAFALTSIDPDGVVLDRSETYWNRGAVKLERVRFVPKENAEQALQAYRAGDVDAVTNANFEPLAIKLLEPFEDFRRTTHGALNFYEINLNSPPFGDRRVRRALALAIDRERLTEGEMEGSAQPAFRFLPFGIKEGLPLTHDRERARELLDEAGFPGGENFPVIRLLINRNNAQQRVARVVAQMWKQNLSVETEIIIKGGAELDEYRDAGEYDLVRRGVVLPTADETANFLSIFGTEHNEPAAPEAATSVRPGISPSIIPESVDSNTNANTAKEQANDALIFTEARALFELHAIPLYFPVSYSLVKSYVSGFESNGIDSPSLADVVIDNNWQPKNAVQ